MSKPWKLVIDWACQKAYDDDVEVYLSVMDEPERRLRTFATVVGAYEWAMGYIADRGCDPGIVRQPDEYSTRLVIHPRPIDIDSRIG